MSSSDEEAVRTLYKDLIAAWNNRDAAAMAALYEAAADQVGFDGSQMKGAAQIETELGAIFANHMTASYVTIIREVRFLTPEVALLRATAGMVPRDGHDINPAVNAIQSLVAVKRGDTWRVALYHNTPAQFHGRPELAQQLTDELRQLVK